MEKYYIVDRSILPDSFDKVIQARKLLETGKASNVSDAVKLVNISRGTYYKYKDLVFLPDESTSDRKAVFSMILDHEPGILSKVLLIISESNASVLTINQDIPIHNMASVSISLDISHMTGTINDLIDKLKGYEFISNVQLIAVE
ncbi:ACT domain-containing protein [Companilactobacillus kedongensis]|uniref:ACT domain-containing protein n=1 Tax=Companilactobacillus kedongensis TaxID=2486004 RepID=UPI000F77EBB2|nr:ACT domain-containing protein [Companilactobacillus kedongensis]